MTKSIIAVLLSAFAAQQGLAMPANPWLSYVGYGSDPTATAASDYPQFTPDPTVGPYGFSGNGFGPSGTGYPLPTGFPGGVPAGVPVVDPFLTTAEGNAPVETAVEGDEPVETAAEGNAPVETAAPVVPGPGGPFGAGRPFEGRPGPGAGAGPGAPGGFGGPEGFGGAGGPGGRPFGGRPGFGRPGPPPFARDADNLGGARRAR